MTTRTRVWVTRAEPGASTTARRLVGMGCEPQVAPLLEVRALAVAPDLDGVAALAFTSANAARAFAALTAERALPAYAVGPATAHALRQEGFSVAGTGSAGVEALARLIIRDPDRPASGTVLHPCAIEPAGDLISALRSAGVRAERLVVYETRPVFPPPPQALDALRQGQVAAVLLHSPKAARALRDLAAARELGPTLGSVRALALSPACLAPLADLTFAERTAAERPSERALLALVRPRSWRRPAGPV